MSSALENVDQEQDLFEYGEKKKKKRFSTPSRLKKFEFRWKSDLSPASILVGFLEISK